MSNEITAITYCEHLGLSKRVRFVCTKLYGANKKHTHLEWQAILREDRVIDRYSEKQLLRLDQLSAPSLKVKKKKPAPSSLPEEKE